MARQEGVKENFKGKGHSRGTVVREDPSDGGSQGYNGLSIRGAFTRRGVSVRRRCISSGEGKARQFPSFAFNSSKKFSTTIKSPIAGSPTALVRIITNL